MKVVINDCYGGFGLSEKAENLYQELAGKEFNSWHADRSDPFLVQVVEQLGGDADGVHAKLGIVDIPDDVDWYVDEYDGMETIHERHRSWSVGD